jgi:acyl-CoA dehydrogenase
MAFSLSLNPAQRDLVERTHRFAEEEIRPVAAEYDRNERPRRASTTRSSTAT